MLPDRRQAGEAATQPLQSCLQLFIFFTGCLQPFHTQPLIFLHPFIHVEKPLLPDRRQAGEAATKPLQSCLQLFIFFTSCAATPIHTLPSFSSSLYFLHVKKPLLRSSATPPPKLPAALHVLHRLPKAPHPFFILLIHSFSSC